MTACEEEIRDIESQYRHCLQEMRWQLKCRQIIMQVNDKAPVILLFLSIFAILVFHCKIAIEEHTYAFLLFGILPLIISLIWIAIFHLKYIIPRCKYTEYVQERIDTLENEINTLKKNIFNCQQFGKSINFVDTLKVLDNIPKNNDPFSMFVFRLTIFLKTRHIFPNTNEAFVVEFLTFLTNTTTQLKRSSYRKSLYCFANHNSREWAELAHVLCTPEWADIDEDHNDSFHKRSKWIKDTLKLFLTSSDHSKVFDPYSSASDVLIIDTQ